VSTRMSHPTVIPFDNGVQQVDAGESTSVSELVVHLREQGYSAGVRAGLEFFHQLGQLLVDLADASGVAHGALSPDHVRLGDADPIRLVGPTLPRLSSEPHPFRHAPPERLRGEPEDLGSDFFVAALMAVELMVGRPVYRGTDDQVRRRACRGDARLALKRWRSTLPAGLLPLLDVVLAPCPLDRPEDYRPVVRCLADLLADPTVVGPHLHQVVALALESRRVAQLSEAPTVVHLVRKATAHATTPRPTRIAAPPVPCSVVAAPSTRRFDLIDRQRQRVHTVELSTDLTVAEAIAELARGPLVPAFTPMGQLQGWFALHADGQRLDWDLRLADLDRSIVQLDAELIPRHMVEAVVCLPARHGGTELRAMVNAALPLRWVLEPLVHAAGVAWDDLTGVTDGCVWLNGAIRPPLAPIGDGRATEVRVDFHPGVQRRVPPRLVASA